MSLSSIDSSFLERRANLSRHWSWVGGLLLLLLFLFTGWLWITVPYLINPWEVAAALEAGTLAEPTKTLMAAMLPAVMLFLVTFAMLSVGLAFVAFANERRLIRLVRQQHAAAGNEPGEGSA